MTSLWGYLRKGLKNTVIPSSKKETTKIQEDDRRKHNESRYLDTGSEDSSNSNDDLRASFDEPRVSSISTISIITESIQEGTKKDKARRRKDSDKKYVNITSNGKLAAYNIFGDEYRSMKGVEEDRNNCRPKAGLSGNASRGLHNEKHKFTNHRDKEHDNDDVGVQVRQRRRDLFSDVLSKYHKHSLQMPFPEKDSDDGRIRSDFTTNNTFSGYIPRTVSRHDTSAILFGGLAQQEELLSKHGTSKAHYLRNVHDKKFRFTNAITKYMKKSSTQRSKVVISNDNTSNRQSLSNTDAKQAQCKNNKPIDWISLNSPTSRRQISDGKSSHKSDTLNSSRFMPGNTQLSPRDVSPSLSGTPYLQSTAAGKRLHLRDIPPGFNIRSIDNGGKGVRKNISQSGCNKTNSMSNRDLEPDLSRRTRSSESKGDEINDEGENIVLAHLKKVVDSNSGSYYVKQLEVLFNSGREVFY